VQDSLDEGRDLRFRVKREESSEGELNHRLHRLHGFDSSAIETAGRLGEFRVLIGVDELTTPPKNRQLIVSNVSWSMGSARRARKAQGLPLVFGLLSEALKRRPGTTSRNPGAQVVSQSGSIGLCETLDPPTPQKRNRDSADAGHLTN
jgi:hypothetical protein